MGHEARCQCCQLLPGFERENEKQRKIINDLEKKIDQARFVMDVADSVADQKLLHKVVVLENENKALFARNQTMSEAHAKEFSSLARDLNGKIAELENENKRLEAILAKFNICPVCGSEMLLPEYHEKCKKKGGKQ